LPIAGKTHNYISGFYFLIGDHPAFFPSCHHGSVYSYGAHHISYICRFATKKMNIDAEIFQRIKKFLGAVYYLLQYFTRDKQFISING